MYEETVKWGEIGAVDSVCGEIPLRSARTGSRLLSGLLINLSESPIYLIMWTYSHESLLSVVWDLECIWNKSLSWKNLSEPDQAEYSKLNDEVANSGRKQRQGWKRRMGFELNTCHSIEKGFYFSLKLVSTLFCLCMCSHAGWGWGRQSGWDSSAATYRNGVSREQSCQSPSIKSVSVLGMLPVNYLVWLKKATSFFFFFFLREISLCGSPRTSKKHWLKEECCLRQPAGAAGAGKGKLCCTCSGKKSVCSSQGCQALTVFKY